MVKRNLWFKVKGIDEEYRMHYEESDLAEKIKRLGYGIYLVPNAKTWHNIEVSKDNLVYGSVRTNSRAYYSGRNRVLFMKKNASRVQYLIFFLIFLPILTIYYSYIIIKHGSFSTLKSYWCGLFDGIFVKAYKLY